MFCFGPVKSLRCFREGEWTQQTGVQIAREEGGCGAEQGVVVPLAGGMQVILEVLFTAPKEEGP